MSKAHLFGGVSAQNMKKRIKKKPVAQAPRLLMGSRKLKGKLLRLLFAAK